MEKEQFKTIDKPSQAMPGNRTNLISRHRLLADVMLFLAVSSALALPRDGLSALWLPVAACAYVYVVVLLPRPVYLVDLAAYKPAAALEVTRAETMRYYELSGLFSKESLAFMERVLERSGLGEATHLPASFGRTPMDICLRTGREESHAVIFGAVDELLMNTRVPPSDIGVVIVNSSLYSPVPSLASLVVNRYRLRPDVVTHNLSGMGCSAGIIAVDLAKHLLQVHPDTYALVVSTENITLNGYTGNDHSMLLSNTLFRVGGAAVLLSNRHVDRCHAKYQLVHTVRTHRGASDQSHSCVWQQEDEAGQPGVSLSKGLMSVAGAALRANITTLGRLVLPFSEQLRFLASVVAKRLFHAGAKYRPDFTSAVEHFCIHAGGRSVLDELQRSLGLGEWHMEPSRMTLCRFGNTSSSSLWYELAYCEAKGRIRAGDRVWQISFGSGFKCNSAVWKALRTVEGTTGESSPWAQNVHVVPASPCPRWAA